MTSLVAEKDAHILGQVLLSRMSAPFPALALGLVSVSVEQQRRGIESALIRAAVERAREDGWIGIFVLGDPKYYGRFGFNADGAAGSSTPYAGSPSMVLTFTPSLPAIHGDLHHAPAFAALESSRSSSPATGKMGRRVDAALGVIGGQRCSASKLCPSSSANWSW